MNPDPNDFETLRKLMALKRHEQPSSEYLDQLSGSIINRIERGEGQLSLFDRISGNFAMRPTLVYACGLTICGALGLTAIYMAREGMEEQAAENSPAMALRNSVPPPMFANQSEPVPIHVANWLGNTNPPAEVLPIMSLFSPQRATVQVSYHSGNCPLSV